MKRWRCPDCKTISNDDALLTAANPFDAEDVVNGCPKCKLVFGEQAQMMCDEPGCEELYSGGWPSGAVYRFTCYKHRKPG